MPEMERCDGRDNDCDSSTDEMPAAMSCGTVAHGAPSCSGGLCTIGTCTDPWRDCDRVLSTGCETDTARSVSACGSCGMVCPSVSHGTPDCVDGRCVIGSCTSPWDDCNTAVTDGCETNTNTSGANCGMCGHACAFGANSTAVCSGGACGLMCSTGFANCDGDPTNGCESNPMNDPDNCSACGVRCVMRPNTVPRCSAGMCIFPCASGWGDCDGSTSNGCETSLNTATNCGSCGSVCSSPRTCTLGSCI